MATNDQLRPLTFGIDGSNPTQTRVLPGSMRAPDDARRSVAPSAAGNVVEMFPDYQVLHARNKALSVDFTAGALQNLEVGRWVLPFDAYAVNIAFELLLPNQANVLSGYLRVGRILVPASQDIKISEAIDPFWRQISGTLGSKVRVFDSSAPYGRRVQRGQAIVASLQMIMAAGAVAAVEFDVQIRVLNLGLMQASGPT